MDPLAWLPPCCPPWEDFEGIEHLASCTAEESMALAFQERPQQEAKDPAPRLFTVIRELGPPPDASRLRASIATLLWDLRLARLLANSSQGHRELMHFAAQRVTLWCGEVWGEERFAGHFEQAHSLLQLSLALLSMLDKHLRYELALGSLALLCGAGYCTRAEFQAEFARLIAHGPSGYCDKLASPRLQYARQLGLCADGARAIELGWYGFDAAKQADLDEASKELDAALVDALERHIEETKNANEVLAWLSDQQQLPPRTASFFLHLAEREGVAQHAHTWLSNQLQAQPEQVDHQAANSAACFALERGATSAALQALRAFNEPADMLLRARAELLQGKAQHARRLAQEQLACLSPSHPLRAQFECLLARAILRQRRDTARPQAPNIELLVHAFEHGGAAPDLALALCEAQLLREHLDAAEQWLQIALDYGSTWAHESWGEALAARAEARAQDLADKDDYAQAHALVQLALRRGDPQHEVTRCLLALSIEAQWRGPESALETWLALSPTACLEVSLGALEQPNENLLSLLRPLGERLLSQDDSSAWPLAVLAFGLRYEGLAYEAMAAAAAGRARPPQLRSPRASALLWRATIEAYLDLGDIGGAAAALGGALHELGTHPQLLELTRAQLELRADHELELWQQSLIETAGLRTYEKLVEALRDNPTQPPEPSRLGRLLAAREIQMQAPNLLGAVARNVREARLATGAQPRRIGAIGGSQAHSNCTPKTRSPSGRLRTKGASRRALLAAQAEPQGQRWF